MPPGKDSNDYIDRLRQRVEANLANNPAPSHLQRRFPFLRREPKIDITALNEDPELQQSLAYMVQYTPSKWLLEQEAALLADRRELHGQNIPRFQQNNPGEDIYDWARKHRLTGMCFSGGGIRSATFNLGILQGLAVKGWLDQVDYLSSVSGGGHIHSWLVAWLKRKSTSRKERNLPQPELAAWQHVMSRLVPLPHHEPGQPFQAVWPSEIQWLRRNSNYLTPHKGAFTGDTWSAVASWIRNVSVNQGLLVSIFLAVLCVPHLVAPNVHLQPYQATAATTSSVVSSVTAGATTTTLTLGLGPAQPVTMNDGLAATPTESFAEVLRKYVRWDAIAGGMPMAPWSRAAFLFFLLAGVSIGRFLRVEYSGSLPWKENELPDRRGNSLRARFRRWQIVWANVLIVAPMLLFGLCLTHVTLMDPGTFTLRLFFLLAALVWIETFSGGALAETVRLERERRKACSPQTEWEAPLWWRAGWAALLAMLGVPIAAAGALVGTLIAAGLNSVWMRDIARWLLLDRPTSVQMVLGTLLFFWLPLFTAIIASGFIGKNFPGWLGEWLARIRGYFLLAGLGWVFLCGSSLLMPGFLLRLLSMSYVKWPAIITWIATTAGGVLGGKNIITSGDQSTAAGPRGKVLQFVVLAGAYVYIGGLVFFLSLALERGSLLIPAETFPLGEPGVWIALIVFFAGFATLLGTRLDISQFSMHSFYRNRLTRCYLGASNEKRNPSPITGFDERDSNDLSINRLTPASGYPGPMPIFCCAMNITTGKDLAWHERKAASFAFTPLYSGYSVDWTEWRKNLRFNGFVPTGMLYPGGPDLATAMAASGATVSPSWVYTTNPAAAFLMTTFDMRLRVGLWVPNPRRSAVAGQRLDAAADDVPPASPAFAPFRLLSELLGSVDDTSKYVYLIDGGLFDNMGLYELVRRRCYRIVICDAEADSAYTFEGIGAAIRKCRVDFGAAINLDLSGLSPNTNSKLSPAQIVRGTIRYPETLPGQDGEVIYIKASLTGKAAEDGSPPPVEGTVELPDVPGDVQNYKLQHEDFPHDSTAEQGFTESQFESYRRLGQRVVARLDRLFTAR